MDLIKKSDVEMSQTEFGFGRAQEVGFAARTVRFIVVIIVVVHAPRSERL